MSPFVPFVGGGQRGQTPQKIGTDPFGRGGAAAVVGAVAMVAMVLAGCGGERGEREREGGTEAVEAGRGGETWVGEFSGERALGEAVEFYGLGAKVAGSEGAARGAEWIAGRLEAEGWEVRVDEFEDATPGGTQTFRNVEGRLGSGERRVLFGAHYDTKGGIPGFAGANDSASGVGVLLELARALKGAPAGTEWVLLFFDGEECTEKYGPRDGLHGSRHASRRLKAEGRTGPFLLFDMVGDADLRVTFPKNSSPELARAAMAAAEAEGVRRAFGLYPGTILDDHVPFAEEGFPVLDFIDFEYGSSPGLNDYWHTPADTPDKLSAASLEIVGRVALRCALRLP